MASEWFMPLNFAFLFRRRRRRRCRRRRRSAEAAEKKFSRKFFFRLGRRRLGENLELCRKKAQLRPKKSSIAAETYSVLNLLGTKRVDSSDLDENLTETIAAMKTIT